MKYITIVAGARPNFMKAAPIIHEIIKKNNEGILINYKLVHTGQHYDKKMSANFFEQLNIPEPDENLNAGGGSQAEQTAAIMIRFEKYLINNFTELVLVVGDVNSTMACAITAQKLGIKVAHVEAGIRSHDWTMPEEINRIITDSISNYFFTTSELANKNLKLSGFDDNQIYYVGNTMIDTLYNNESRFIKPVLWDEIKLKAKEFIVMTMHRPANVDQGIKLKEAINIIIQNSRESKLIFPVHPRTRKIMDGLDIKHPRLFIVDPLGYLEFNYLVSNSLAVITDSGGITEETTVLGIPCLTLRDNTERPETITIGTNELIGTDPKNIIPALNKLYSGRWKKGKIPKFWDGKTAERIVSTLIKL